MWLLLFLEGPSDSREALNHSPQCRAYSSLTDSPGRPQKAGVLNSFTQFLWPAKILFQVGMAHHSFRDKMMSSSKSELSELSAER